MSLSKTTIYRKVVRLCSINYSRKTAHTPLAQTYVDKQKKLENSCFDRKRPTTLNAFTLSKQCLKFKSYGKETRRVLISQTVC